MKIVAILVAVLALTSPAIAESQLIDPNLASVEELQQVPDIDQTLALSIVEGRPYLTAGDLDALLAETLGSDARGEVYARLFRQVDLNRASEDEIMLIPGMTQRMAHEFEEYRPYGEMAQFRREIGKYVDETEVARLQEYVFIPVSLNTASEAEIMRIPGMTKRMAHEFEEYRPYTDIEQFRREIGKYVDSGEVARLESYVTLD